MSPVEPIGWVLAASNESASGVITMDELFWPSTGANRRLSPFQLANQLSTEVVDGMLAKISGSAPNEESNRNEFFEIDASEPPRSPAAVKFAIAGLELVIRPPENGLLKASLANVRLFETVFELSAGGSALMKVTLKFELAPLG